MKNYSSLKDSGIEWIGEIPSHWDISKIMFVSENVTDGSHYSPKITDNGKLYVTVSNVTKYNEIDFESCSKISEESFNDLVKNGCQPIKGDILITKDGTIGRGLVVGEFNDYVILSSLGLIRFNNEINPYFGLYYLLSGLNIDQMYSNVRGSGITRLTISLIKNLLLIIPPIHEQKRIVSFLDKKTFKIDRLIQSKQRKIELLKEKRTSLINEVVTKGLNPDVEMKDSGLEWIGEIPSHWEIVKTGYLSQLLTGHPWKSSDFSYKEGIKIVRGENVSEGFLRWGSRTRKWNKEVVKGDTYYLNEGDIVIGMDGSKVGKNYVLITEEDLPLILHQRMCRVRTNEELNPHFLKYFVGSPMFHYYIDISKTDPMVPHITQKNIFDFPISLPSIEEQREIVEFLDFETKTIDKTLHLEKQKIDLLKEYKKSLISEVVTGKVNVQEEVDEVLV